MELPDDLYRVESSCSVSRFDEEQGILAGDPTWHPNAYDDRDAMKAAVVKHLDWHNREPTPFISTTNSQTRAMKEAKRKRDAGETDVQIIIVDPHIFVEGMGGQVARVDTVVDKHDLPGNLRMFVTDTEFLAFGEIPSFAVTHILELEDFELYCRYKKSYPIYNCGF